MKKKHPQEGYKQPKEWLTKDEYNQLINNPYLPRKDDLIIQMLTDAPCGSASYATSGSGISTLKMQQSAYGRQNGQTTRHLIPIPAPVLKMITQWITDNRLTKIRHLFFSQQSTTISRTQIHRLIKEASQKAGIEKEITTHSMRRSRAANLLDAGLPLEQVSRLLRHKYLSSTMIYLRISIKGLQQAISKIDTQDND